MSSDYRLSVRCPCINSAERCRLFQLRRFLLFAAARAITAMGLMGGIFIESIFILPPLFSIDAYPRGTIDYGGKLRMTKAVIVV